MDQKSTKSRRKFLEQLGVVGAGLVGIPYLTTGCDSKSISADQSNTITVSYTHLTLPTICSV